MGVGTEAGDLERGVRQLAVPERLLAIVLDAPDLAGGVIPVDVGALQFRVALAVVDDPVPSRRWTRSVRVAGRVQLAVVYVKLLTLSSRLPSHSW